MKLHKLAFALSTAIFWSITIALLPFICHVFAASREPIRWMARFYRGYSTEFIGAIFGFLWAFCDAFILGYLFAALYNRLAAMKWFGFSNQRPQAIADPLYSDYSARWTSNHASFPNRWSARGRPWIILQPAGSGTRMY